jgi:hypothetical protein
MTASVPSGGLAVMQNRRTGLDSLDFFPTPPWATRALCEHVLAPVAVRSAVWEPAAGAGHMSEVLKEYFGMVLPSDVHDYGHGYLVGSFVGEGVDVLQWPLAFPPQWIITNPPFNLALEFAYRALDVASRGVALLVRSAWLEGGDRYRRLFHLRPPTTVALFSERVPMVKGRWDPKASTATAYAWVVWRQSEIKDFPTRLVWIPPGCRTSLTKPDDAERFASRLVASSGE